MSERGSEIDGRQAKELNTTGVLKEKNQNNKIELLFKTTIQESFLEIKTCIHTFFILGKIEQE